MPVLTRTCSRHGVTQHDRPLEGVRNTRVPPGRVLGALALLGATPSFAGLDMDHDNRNFAPAVLEGPLAWGGNWSPTDGPTRLFQPTIGCHG